MPHTKNRGSFSDKVLKMGVFWRQGVKIGVTKVKIMSFAQNFEYFSLHFESFGALNEKFPKRRSLRKKWVFG